MAIKKVKSTAKEYISDRAQINSIVTSTMTRISDIVGSTLGPNGRISLIESDQDGIPDKPTKDGVTVFKSLGAHDAYEHMITEQVRSAATRTASEAGDGTTTATILACSLTTSLLKFCDENPKLSPQRVVRIIQKTLKEKLLPAVAKSTIKIGNENKDILNKVAKISANGDDDISNAVIEAFDIVGYGASSHVTIQELSGPGGYKVEALDGYPIPIGYEESIGKFHSQFINDAANIRCVLEKPVFILFDGMVNDLVNFGPIIETIGKAFEAGSDVKNIVIISHGFSEMVLNDLAANFATQGTLKVFPLVTPMNAVVNSRQNFLVDMSAFTGAKVFGMKDPVSKAEPEDLGFGMERFESYRFRSTLVGESAEENIAERAAVLRKQLENPESAYAQRDLEERLGKLTSGIAIIKIYAGSSGELKERHDRVEDAVCAVRAAITHGALPGGCRMLVDLAVLLQSVPATEEERVVWDEVLAPTLLQPITKLLDNAGFVEEQIGEMITKLIQSPNSVYDVENHSYGSAVEMGLFDATKAVEEALKNAVSIASVMGVLGGMVVHPRDNQLENQEAKAEAHFKRHIDRVRSQRSSAKSMK